MQLKGYPLMVGPHSYLFAERDRLAELKWQNFDALPLSPTIGAEISGIDLADDLPEAVIDEVRQALFDYKVIFFRGQPLTPEQHTRFAHRFGPLEEHPFLPSNTGEPELVRFEKGPQLSGYENAWHHDVTWREIPSMGAILHAVQVPGTGGDTLFSDMYAAYDGLDDDTKSQIEGRYAVHDFMATFGGLMDEEERKQMRGRYPAQRHPIVCTHPGTGKRYLYVNRPFVSHLEGFEAADGHALLDRLCRQADYPEHQCRFHWTPDTVAFWDNRAVQHYATSDYSPAARIMERASIVGTRPTP